MSDEASQPVKVEEPTNVDVVKTEDATVADPTPETQNAVNTEAGEVKTEGDVEVEAIVKNESQNEDGVDRDAKQETDEKKESPNILKTKAVRYNRNNHRENNKFDPSLAPVTDDPAELSAQIRHQVEFYFGNSNLPQDKFLWQKTGGTKNRPVSLKTICSFGRMKNFKSYDTVVAALRESKELVLTGEPGEEHVARREPYDPISRANLLERSVYIKGFGDEQPSTQFDIEAFIASYQPANAVRLRRTPQNLFKGSVFAEFDTPELAQAFLAVDPPPKWQGHDLKIMLKQDYVDEKQKLIDEGKLAPSEPRQRAFWGPSESANSNRDGGRGGRGGRGGQGGRGGRDNRGRDNARGGNRGHNGRDRRNGGDPNDWKTRKAEDRNRGHGRRDRNDKRADKDESDSTNKRPREDDAGDGLPATKKVDIKTESAVKTQE